MRFVGELKVSFFKGADGASRHHQLGGRFAPHSPITKLTPSSSRSAHSEMGPLWALPSSKPEPGFQYSHTSALGISEPEMNRNRANIPTLYVYPLQSFT